MSRTPEQEHRLQTNAQLGARYKFSPQSELNSIKAAVTKKGGPHLHVENPPNEWEWMRGDVDFRIELYPLPQDEKDMLLLQAYTRGVSMESDGKWAVLPSTLTQPIPVDRDEAYTYVMLPSFWREYLVVVR